MHPRPRPRILCMIVVWCTFMMSAAQSEEHVSSFRAGSGWSHANECGLEVWAVVPRHAFAHRCRPNLSNTCCILQHSFRSRTCCIFRLLASACPFCCAHLRTIRRDLDTAKKVQTGGSASLLQLGAWFRMSCVSACQHVSECVNHPGTWM